MYIVVGALVLNWAMISLTHLKIYQHTEKISDSNQVPCAMVTIEQLFGFSLYCSGTLYYVDSRL